MTLKTLNTPDLKGGRFMFSARQRAARAAQMAWEGWPLYAERRKALGEPVRERWSYAIDIALVALTDGEGVEP